MSDKKIYGYAAIALDKPKFEENVGAVLRAAAVYGAAMVVTSGRRFAATARTNTYRAELNLPYLPGLESVFDALPYDCVPVGVELTEEAIPLYRYEHPDRAFYVFGAEDQTMGTRILDRCRDVVKIPAGSHNLACAVNVVLYDRLAKQLRALEGL